MGKMEIYSVMIDGESIEEDIVADSPELAKELYLIKIADRVKAIPLKQLVGKTEANRIEKLQEKT